jgi:hypothetical protein
MDPLFAGRVSSDDEPRGGMVFPYALVIDHINEGVAIRGDRRAMAWRRTVQVSVFQRTATEDPALLDSVLNALDGATVPGAWHLRVDSSTRAADPDPKVVHHAVTCSLARPR